MQSTDWVDFPTKILPAAGINTCRQRRKQCKHQLKTGCRETMNIEHSLLTESKERREEGVTLYYLDLDLEIVATKWKLTAVSTIGKRGSRASGCLQCEDGRSGFWAPPSLQSATSASFTGHRFFRLSSPNSRSLAVESWKESSKSDSDPLLQQVFSFFHRSIEWAIF